MSIDAICGRFGLALFLMLVVASAMPAAAQDCLPVAMPDRDQIFAAPRRVFAHYFNRLPLALGSRDPAQDYYTRHYLRPDGENNKWLAQGGYLRSRPLPPEDAGASDPQQAGAQQEIRQALARGIGGFTYDILSPDDVRPGGRLDSMLAAAANVDDRFRIMLMPDMASLGKNMDQVIAIVKQVYDDKGLYHLSDGRLVVAPFMAEAVPAAAWGKMLRRLRQAGFEVAFLPTFLSLKPAYADAYAAISDGLGAFGTPLPGQGETIIAAAELAHAKGKIFMAGISPQGYRPKNFIYWEALGSQAYRAAWMGAIDGQADLVQLTSWNDFSESTQLAPYTDGADAAGSGYYDLTGYFAAWYLMQDPPKIVRDMLFYFYRRQSVDAAAVNGGQDTLPAPGTPPGQDRIELAGFLTEPGTLQIESGGYSYSQPAAAGLRTMTAPLAAGTPRFSLLRRAGAVIGFDGAPPVTGMQKTISGYADLTYWSGDAAVSGGCGPVADVMP